MALRILWDEYETSLLIDTWLSIEKGNVSRREAIANLSKLLRERAVKNGIEIDDIFRNENGISMQLIKVDRLMTRQLDAQMHNTKIFADMVEMYYEDRHHFDEILIAAKGGDSRVKTKEELFAEWLSDNVPSGRLSESFMSISDVERYAREKNLVKGSIYDLSNPAITFKIMTAISSDRIFRITHKKQMRGITEVAQLFHRYTKENQNKKAKVAIEPRQEEMPHSPPPAIPSGGSLYSRAGTVRREPQSTSSVSHHDSKALFRYSGVRKHPGQAEFEAWLTESDTPMESIQTYSAAVKRIGDALLENGIEYRHLYSIFGVSRLEHIRDSLEQDQSCARAVGKIISSDIYAFRKYVKFRRNDPADDSYKITLGRHATVLKENFENGFRVGSLIDRKRFRQFYLELYGEETPQDDDEILEAIKQVGELQDDRIFIRESSSSRDLLDDIQEDIAEAFGKGASCIFVASVFEKYQQALATGLQIYGEEVLREQLLATCYGAYFATKQYFCIRGRSPDASADVKRLLKQSPLPMTYHEIHGVLWYIPIDTIKHSLVVTSGMVNVAQETYFYAGNLPISTSEIDHIAELMQAQLSQKTFITDTDLQTLIRQHCPSVAINTESFTTWGLRNALSVMLKDRFSFSGSIISERGQEINMAQAFEAFCDSRNEMSLEDLRDFAREMNSTIRWDVVFTKMLRISQKEFVKRSMVNFDVQNIDMALDQLMDGDYVPLKKFSLFLHFPPVSVKWNEFVLEGYVAQYSHDFMLLHASYTVTECCGAIVRRSSHIQDFKTLVTIVLAKSEGWKTQSDALALLVKKGYLQRKRYSEMDIVVTNARHMREMKRKGE